MEDKIIEITEKDLNSLKEDIKKETKMETMKEMAEKAELEKQKESSKKNPDYLSFENIQVGSHRQKNALGQYFLLLGKSMKGRMSVEKASKEIDNLHPLVQKYMNTGTIVDGGALVGEMYADFVVNELNAKAVIRQAGVNIVEMPSGNLSIPKVTSGATGYWMNELGAKTASTINTGFVKLSVKKAAVDVPISNELIIYGSNSLAQSIQDNIITKLANLEDLAYISGAGTEYTPKGMTLWAGNTDTMTGSPTAITIAKDLSGLVGLLAADNVEMSKPFWLLHPTTSNFLKALTDTNGQFTEIARSLTTSKTLMGYPVFESTQADSGTVILADASYLYIGQGRRMQANFVENGSYWNGSVYVSGQATDSSVFTGLIEVDFVTTQANAIGTLTGVTWGA